MPFFKRRHDKADDNRAIHINKSGPAEHHKNYLGNATSTTKYSVWTFLPKALFEQYRRVANIYFTIVAALSLTPFTPVRAWTTWTPLIIVLGVAMIKEAAEDYKRYKQDKEINNRSVQVLDPEKDPGEDGYVTKMWKDVRVGDILIVTKDQQFPADLLFLTSETEEGTCYIETMNLDGETNLKIKKAPDETKGMNQQDFSRWREAVIECEGPNARLYQFTGNLLLGGKTLPISPAAILLRGCNLRNTDKVVGAVIYAGHETKIFKNSAPAPSKRSRVERIVDKIIFFMFGLLFSFCICGAVYFAIWTKDRSPKHWYLGSADVSGQGQYDPESPAFVGFASFITSFILYGYLIPISLYVSMELVKIAQSMGYINNDRDMYHAETDTPALARTSNLNEELGMVNTILSDKTGTLTRNVMEFFKCSIAGVPYGAGITEIEKANALRKGTVLDDRERPAAGKFRERFFNFYDERLMGEAWYSAKDPETIEMFFRLLAVCHTVIPDGPTEPETIKYEAESPDEAALVVAAKAFGFFFFKRTNTSVVVRERTARGVKDVEYEVLNILEFNSTRKRMSVVVKEKDNDRLIIFTKGADTVIYERLDPNYAPNDELKLSTSRDMEDFGAAGLRTLCLSYAELDRDWYTNVWMPEWIEAKTSLDDRERKLGVAGEKIEKNLRLLGCTAIEDKLQEGVPDCIRMLALAGIRIWVLTGDKMETAINIGFACSLLTDDMKQYTVTATSARIEDLEQAGRREEAEALAAEQVAKQLDQIESSLSIASSAAAGGGVGAGVGGEAVVAALIIDGKALAYALTTGLAPVFLRVGLRCQAVVCCRVSPLQKAMVTTLVRSAGSITLAIGDGANDVGMIQSAHIGVGISGQEGMQAVMSADFAIAQFRYLVPLLLIHGQYSYKRISRMINFFFYKNMLFAITLFMYSAFTTFSGSYIYNDTSMTLFNVIFTSATPLLVGMFDMPLSKRSMLRYPQLYRQGVANADFSPLTILGWMLSAALQSAIILTLVLLGASGLRASGEHGIPWGMAEVGVVMFTAVVLTVHLHLAMLEEAWTWIHHVSVWGSIALWYIYLLAFGLFPVSWSLEMWHLFGDVVAPNIQFWLFSLLVPLAAVLPDMAFRALRRLVSPTDDDIVREIGKLERAAALAQQLDSAASGGDHAHDYDPAAAPQQQGSGLPHHVLQKHKGGSSGCVALCGVGSGSGGNRNKVAPEPFLTGGANSKTGANASASAKATIDGVQASTATTASSTNDGTTTPSTSRGGEEPADCIAVFQPSSQLASPLPHPLPHPHPRPQSQQGPPSYPGTSTAPSRGGGSKGLVLRGASPSAGLPPSLGADSRGAGGGTESPLLGLVPPLPPGGHRSMGSRGQVGIGGGGSSSGGGGMATSISVPLAGSSSQRQLLNSPASTPLMSDYPHASARTDRMASSPLGGATPGAGTGTNSPRQPTASVAGGRSVLQGLGSRQQSDGGGAGVSPTYPAVGGGVREASALSRGSSSSVHGAGLDPSTGAVAGGGTDVVSRLHRGPDGRYTGSAVDLSHAAPAGPPGDAGWSGGGGVVAAGGGPGLAGDLEMRSVGLDDEVQDVGAARRSLRAVPLPLEDLVE